MNLKMKSLIAVLCCVAAAGTAWTQQPAKPTAQSEAGEPRADTSQPTPPSAAPRAPAPAPAREPVGASTGTGAPAAGQTGAIASGAATPGAGASPAGPAAGKIASDRPAAAGPKGVRSDRLELGTATVTGSQEQPKVMYIVPWKRSDIGDLAGKPMNSLVDEILAPVDRDVFKREVLYYQAVQADASQNGAVPKPSQQGEK